MTSQFITLFSRGFILLIFAFGLAACSDGTNDLRAWVDQIKRKPPGAIRSMPEIIEYKPHDYSSSALKSPFADLALELESQLQAIHEGCDEAIQPDISRRKEDLERFSLDSMEMVGLIQDKDSLWGLIQMTAGSEKGKVYHVTKGSYLGVNHGKIVSITEQQLEVETLVPDSKGCWEKRTIYMAMALEQ